MPQIYLISQNTLPNESANQAQIQSMSDEFGSLAVRNEEIFWAEQGVYKKVCNPAFGTGIAMGIQTSFSDTANVLMLMRNGSATKKVIPHYIRLICTAAGASSTSAHLGIVLDNANRYSSGGTDLVSSIVNANSGQVPGTAVDVLRFGAITANAAVAKRQISRAVMKTQAAPCWTVGDEVKILFGSDADMGNVSGSAAVKIACNVGPVVLEGQNHCLLIHLWNPANATTAPSFELEAAWWER